MIIDSIKSPDSTNKLKQLTSEWKFLIHELKHQPKSKPQLPPILSQRKSPLQNYKNAQKLHESGNYHKKTITQKILDLSRKRKMSTVNLNEQITRQKRNPSQQLPILTEEQKQLLASKQLTKYPKQTQRKTSIKKIDISHAKSIINQFNLFKSKSKKQKIIQNRDDSRKSPVMTLVKQKKSKAKLIIEESPSQPPEKVAVSVTFQDRLSLLVKQQNQQNRRLSFELSQDSKSLRYRYNRDEPERRQRESIPSVLRKRKKQAIERLSSINRPINISVESQQLIKYPPDDSLPLNPSLPAKYQTELLKLQEKPLGTEKNVISLKPVLQSHIKQKHYIPKKKSSLRTISHNQNYLVTKYQPWEDPDQMNLQHITIESYTSPQQIN